MYNNFDAGNTFIMVRADSRPVPANERGRYKVTPSLIGYAQT